jgi:tetratricopeptide (TPR) repeat protein
MSVHRSSLHKRFWVLGFRFVLLLASSPVIAQDSQPKQQGAAARLLDSARVLIAKATPTGDIPALRGAEALLERAITVSPNDPWLAHYLAFAIYREATIRMGRDRSDIGPLLARVDSILERSAARSSIPESFALRSSVLGMMIGSNPLRGMTLGPQSGAQMEKALAAGPNNPRVWLMRGIGALNTPKMFGGGEDKAEEYLKKSIELFASDHPQPPAPGWGLNEAYIWLGQVYRKQDKIDAARASYQRALTIEPNDVWVRTILLPALDKK